MEYTNIDEEFEKFYAIACNSIKQSDLPQDTQLILYALYKKATNSTVEYIMPTNNTYNNVINAFKLNALLQFKDLTPLQAKNMYIEQVKKLI
nr:acyl-CoA-binding protein [uncultured Flavobacterium sp.]